MVSKQHFQAAHGLPDSLPRRLLDSLLNLIYPETCLICSSAVARQQDCGVCGGCWEKTLHLRISPPWCSSCGLPFQNLGEGSIHLCGNCILRPPPYAGARSFGYYTAELSSLVRGFKFYGKRNLARLFAPLLAATFCDSWSREEIDIVVPVPLHPKRQQSRGYNQAELLARSLAHKMALPFSKHAVIRRKATLPQVGLTDAQRLENVRKAFCCTNPGQVARQRVLLVDDVMTTGATVASASRALLEGGALRVSVLVVARVIL